MKIVNIIENNMCNHTVLLNVKIDLYSFIEGINKLLANQRRLYKIAAALFCRDGGHWTTILKNSEEVYA